MLALDVDAGVPGELRVPLADVLREMGTELARQVEEPAGLLRAAADRPEILPRPFIMLGENLDKFVQRRYLSQKAAIESADLQIFAVGSGANFYW